MKGNMDIKVNTVLMKALLVFLALALLTTSSVAAQPITVDGNGSDWDPSWFLAADPFDSEDYGDAGYNLTGVWQHYNATEDMLYIRYDVAGIAGDSNGNDTPNEPNDNVTDQYGVGAQELYRIQLNTSSTGNAKADYDIVLIYTDNTVIVAGDLAGYTNGDAKIKLTSPFTNVVEFSFDNVSDWLPNPYRYNLYGWVASMMDGPGEDDLDETIYISFPPVANFTFVAGDCNQTVWFDPSGSYDDSYGGIVNYTWDFDDNLPVEVKYDNTSFTHLFSNVSRGAYNVSLTVVDTDNLTDTLVREVLVNRGPDMINVTASKTSVAEPGEWVLFEGWYSDPDGDTLTHRWFIDGVEIANGSSTTYSNVSYFVNHPITVNLTITDPHGCTNRSSVTVTYLHLPVPVINFTATGCLLVELNASESYDLDGHITNYSWDLDNDGTFGDVYGITCTHNFIIGGNHTVGLNVTDNSSLTNTTTKVIYVSGKPTADAQANRSSVATPGATVLFSGTGSACDLNVTNSLNYTWTIHGATYTGATVEYYVTNTTTAFLNVTDEYGCTDTDDVAVTYLHRPVPVINFTATGCLLVELNASNSSDYDGHITNYSWDLDNDGTYGDKFGITCIHNFGAGGNYTIGLEVTDNSSLTNNTTRVIYVSYKPTAVADANRSSVATPGAPVLFSGSGSTYDTKVTNSLSYIWTIHGATYTGATVEYYVTNTTTAFLNVTDEYGCTDTADVAVTYLHRPVPVINFTATGCLEVELNASESYDPDGFITNYTWDTNNDGIYDNGTGVTCPASFGAGGYYTVGLNVTDNSSLTNTTTKVIYVSGKPTADAQANRSSVATPGATVLFSGTGSTYDTNVTNSLSYIWTIHGATYTGATVEYYVTNTTTAFLNVTDEYGCTDTDDVAVTYLHRPVPVINFTATGCLEVELNASESYDLDGHITNYTWDTNNDGIYDNGTGVTCPASFGAGGYYTVGLNVTDNSSLTNTTTKVIYVSGKPTAVAQANRSSVATPGAPVLFSGSGSTYDTNVTNSLNYAWTIHGATYTGATVEYYVTNTTTAFLNVTDEYGCTDTADVTVTYLHRPVPVINFTATGCLEIELNASESYDLDGHITNYTWDTDNDGEYDDGTGVTCTASFGAGGFYTVGLNVTDNSSLTNTTTRVIYVSCKPAADARANQSNVEAPGGWVLFNGTDSTCDTNVTNSLNYTWVIHGATYNDSDGEGVLYYVTNMTTAFLNVTDEYGCTDADDVTVTYLYLPVPVINFTATGCLLVELNATGSYDPDGYITAYEWDLNNDSVYGDENGSTCTASFSTGGIYTIGLKVTDNSSLTNTTRKQVTVTGVPNAVAEANGQTGSLQLPAGGGWVVFDGTNSTAYPGTGIVNASCTWNIPGNGTYPGLGPLLPIFIDRDTTATLSVVANNTCTDVSRVRVRMPPTEEDVPILTPAGMIALIGILCIAGGGRIAKKGRRS